ncbi:MAG TPA: TonB-dependent receptor [Sphingomicrobium sp.]|nr:TonB-dependent receptor [Sphingomicrobium sp.]
MINMSSRTRLAAAASPLAIAMVLASSQPAWAQAAQAANVGVTGAATQDAASQSPAPSADDQAIVVTGFRAALRSATAKKKNSDSVVESITAEDVGKLPDNGIGESIARLPGLAAQRDHGRASVISIRGFGPDFSTTTLNGRQQTTSNDSRAVEFDQYPSEILAGVDIYKTSEADRTAGGLVGNIDLRTLRPLDVGRRIIAVGARGVYVDQKLLPGSQDKGGRVFGTFVDQFADNNIGVSLSVAYSTDPYQTKDWNAWGYGSFGGFPSDVRGMNGIKTWFEAGLYKRLGGNATVQARLDDNLMMTFDGFYSDVKNGTDQKGFEMPFNCGGFCGHDSISNVVIDGRLITAATMMGTPVIENYREDDHIKQFSFGWNTKWDGHNGWKALADVSWSRTKRLDDRLETTAGVIPGIVSSGPTATVSYVMTKHGPEFVSDYDGASSALVLTDVEGWSGSTHQAGYDKIKHVKDDLKEFRGEIERDIGGLLHSIRTGADYTTRSKDLTQDEAFLIPPGNALFASIPTNLLQPTFTLDRGLGPILSWDPRDLVPAGVLDYLPNPSGGAGQAYRVSEDVWSPYVMALLDGDVGSARLTGNIGFQAVHTSTESSGLRPTIKDHYWMWLPSLNLNFRFPSDFVIRFAAAKQFMRPRMDQLNNRIVVGVQNTPTPHYVSSCDGTCGNPVLRPYQAKALDLTFEKYFGTKGYLALQTYYKHMDTYIDSQASNPNFDYSAFPKPVGVTLPPSNIGVFSGPLNTHGGYLYGAELAATLPFDAFMSALSGFGITGGIGYTKSKVARFDGSKTQIPGYSKFVANLTAFYERDGLNVRGSIRHRSGFLGEFPSFNGAPEQQYVLHEDIFDAQIGYDFQPGSALNGLSVYVQGQNLTNERSATIGVIDIPGSWLKYQTYGRRFLIGATYKFGASAPPPPPPPPAPPPPPPEAPATQTCADGSVVLATSACPAPAPPPPPPPAPSGERGF